MQRNSCGPQKLFYSPHVALLDSISCGKPVKFYLTREQDGIVEVIRDVEKELTPENIDSQQQF